MGRHVRVIELDRIERRGLALARDLGHGPGMVHRYRKARRAALILFAVVGIALAAVFGLGGYFDRQAFVLEQPTTARRGDLVAVYWSGDMGMHVGMGRKIIDRIRADGIPVLTASSPLLFARPRDPAFAAAVMTRLLGSAAALPGTGRIAVVASSFGADMVVASLGQVTPALRRKVASVALVGAGRHVYFHANPSGLFYRGPSAIDAAAAVRRLNGVSVSCIFGANDDDSLCRDPAMESARLVMIRDGHMMLHSHGRVATAVLDTIRHPPPPMR